jgi:hypothetical protein
MGRAVAVRQARGGGFFPGSNLNKVRLDSGRPFGHATFAVAGLALLSSGASPEDPSVQMSAKVVADLHALKQRSGRTKAA